MNAKNRIVLVRGAAVVAVLALLTTACDSERTTPPPSHIDQNAGVGTVPGQVTVKLADMNLRVTGAVARLDSAGNGTLTMRIANDGGVPEHVDMVELPDGSRAALSGGRGVNGSMSTAGVLVQTGTSVTFGSRGGPAATLRAVHGVTGRHTLPLIIQFGVAGLVRLQAKVVSG